LLLRLGELPGLGLNPPLEKYSISSGCRISSSLIEITGPKTLGSFFLNKISEPLRLFCSSEVVKLGVFMFFTFTVLNLKAVPPWPASRLTETA
jgi:hypothetical protein